MILIVKACREKPLRTSIGCHTILDDEISDPVAGAGGGAGEGTYVKKSFWKKTAEWQQEVGHFVVGAVGEK